MSLPTEITVFGLLLKIDGTPAKGRVIFTSTVSSLSSGDESVAIPSYKVAPLDDTGAFSITLPASNDPAWNPSEWEYRVSVQTSEYRNDFNTLIPYDAEDEDGTPHSYEFSKLLPALDSDSQLYSPYNHTHAGGGSGGVTSVFGRGGVVVAQSGDYTKTQVGLGNVDNTSDASKPVSSATQTALNGKEATGVAASLISVHNADSTDVHGIADTSTLVTSSDLGSAIAGIDFPVDSVAGKTGTVTLVKGDVGLGNVDNTSDANKPVSSATTTQLNLKAPIASPTFTGTVGGITKAMVGLGSVDNTSDTGKPVSSATQTALNLKADDSDLTTLEGRVGVNEDDIVSLDARVTDLEDAPGGGGTAATIVSGYVSSGDLVGITDTSGAWEIVSDSPTMAIASAVGDNVEIEVDALIDQNNSLTDWFEVALVSGASIVRYASTGTSSPSGAGEGDPSIYPVAGGRFRGSTIRMNVVAVSGDIAGGNVTFKMVHKGPATGKVFAGTDRPLRYRIRNDHQ